MNAVKGFCGFIKNPQLYKFLIVGIVIAAFVLFFTLFLTSILFIHYTISVAISFEIAVIWGFFVHDKWTFADIQKTTSTKSRLVKFNMISIAGLCINEAVLIFFTTQIHLYYFISEVLAIITTFFFNYLFQKKVSWKN